MLKKPGSWPSRLASRVPPLRPLPARNSTLTSPGCCADMPRLAFRRSPSGGSVNRAEAPARSSRASMRLAAVAGSVIISACRKRSASEPARRTAWADACADQLGTTVTARVRVGTATTPRRRGRRDRDVLRCTRSHGMLSHPLLARRGVGRGAHQGAASSASSGCARRRRRVSSSLLRVRSRLGLAARPTRRAAVLRADDAAGVRDRALGAVAAPVAAPRRRARRRARRDARARGSLIRNDLKQYTCDAFCALVVLAVAAWADRDPARSRRVVARRRRVVVLPFSSDVDVRDRRGVRGPAGVGPDRERVAPRPRRSSRSAASPGSRSAAYFARWSRPQPTPSSRRSGTSLPERVAAARRARRRGTGSSRLQPRSRDAGGGVRRVVRARRRGARRRARAGARDDGAVLWVEMAVVGRVRSTRSSTCARRTFSSCRRSWSSRSAWPAWCSRWRRCARGPGCSPLRRCRPDRRGAHGLLRRRQRRPRPPARDTRRRRAVAHAVGRRAQRAARRDRRERGRQLRLLLLLAARVPFASTATTPARISAPRRSRPTPSTRPGAPIPRSSRR